MLLECTAASAQTVVSVVTGMRKGGTGIGRQGKRAVPLVVLALVILWLQASDRLVHYHVRGPLSPPVEADMRLSARGLIFGM